MSAPITFTYAQDQEIARRVRAGETLRQLAAAFGCSTFPIHKALERAIPDKAERLAIRNAKVAKSRNAKARPAVMQPCILARNGWREDWRGRAGAN